MGEEHWRKIYQFILHHSECIYREAVAELKTFGKECIWIRAYDRERYFGKDIPELLNRPPILKDNALKGTSGWANFFLERDHFAAK